MYTRSPPLSRYRRRSSAANNRLVDEEQNSLDTRHTNHNHRHLLPLNRQHCRCCSMSTSDLLSPSSPSLDEVGSRDADGADCEGQDQNSGWRPFDDDDAKMESPNAFLRAQHRRDRRSASRTSSIVSTLSSPNILLLGGDYQLAVPSDNGSRLRERLAASVAGLKELDILREKHRRMVEEVKTQLKLSASETVHQRQQPTADGYSSGQSAAPRSPSPAELSSNLSHRSSLSMDSGVCLSLTSDPASANNLGGYRPIASSYYPHQAHQRRLSTDSVSGYHSFLSPTRKMSWTMSNAGALYDSLVNANNATLASDDEGCYPAAMHAQDACADGPMTYSSLASIAALAAAEASVAVPRSMNGAAQFRYRRRLDGALANGSGSSMAQSRPRSLYGCYPEENTVTIDSPISPHQVFLAQQPPPNMRPLHRTNVQYRPQVPTIVANLPDSKVALHSDLGWDSSAVICRRRLNGGRISAVDPVFRASRVFIDTLPENEALLDTHILQSDGDFRSNVFLRPRRYETRRSRPTSVAVAPSVSIPLLPSHEYLSSSPPRPSSALKKQNSADSDHLNDWRRAASSNSFTWEEAKRMLDPAFVTRTSSSSTLVRQHSSASATSNGCSGRPSPKVSNRRRHSKSPVLQGGTCKNGENPSMVNVSVVTTGDASSASSTCGAASDGCISDGSSVLVVNGTSCSHSTQNNGMANGNQEHKSISRSISSQSSDSNKSKRNKEKTWRESADL